jgi:hypothetical protein
MSRTVLTQTHTGLRAAVADGEPMVFATEKALINTLET